MRPIRARSRRPGSLIDLQNRCLAAPLRVLWTTYGVGRIDREDLADHHPVEEHSQSGQPLLHRGFGVELELRLHKHRDMDWFHLGEIQDTALGTESRELPNRLHIGKTGIGIADMRAEEISHSRAGFRSRREDGRNSGSC